MIPQAPSIYFEILVVYVDAMIELLEPLTAQELSRISGAQLTGNPEAIVSKLGALDELTPGVLSFFADPKMTSRVKAATGGVLFCEASLVRENQGLTFLTVAEPKLAFTKLAEKFSIRVQVSGVSPHAIVSPDATIDASASVGPFAVIEAGAIIGKNTKIGAYVYVGNDAILGESCEIFPRVTILERVKIGNRVKIYPGAVIGSSGFGYFESRSAGGLVELPQIGTVVIEDDVRIGANSAVDRATFNQTKVGRGTKLDNLVQIGHNVTLGRHNIICGISGVAGSSVLGDGVVLGGGVLVGDGVTIGAGARLGMSTCTTSDLEGGQGYVGTPPVPVKEYFRNHLNVRKLSDVFKRIARLEKSSS